MDAGYSSAHFANPAAIKQYEGLKHSDDQHDAFFLAQLLILGILPQGYIYPKKDRPVRDLALSAQANLDSVNFLKQKIKQLEKGKCSGGIDSNLQQPTVNRGLIFEIGINSINKDRKYWQSSYTAGLL